MAEKLTWDTEGERFYETGVKKGVLYTKKKVGDTEKWVGTAWNGLISVTETPSGAEANALYADDIKYLNLISKEELGGTIEAYQSPEEFDECDGTVSLLSGLNVGQQTRKEFALCYRTAIGNDTKGADHGYKLHIIYGCKASPSDRQYSTMNDSPEAMTLSWEFTTTPVTSKNKIELPDGTEDYITTSLITVDSTKFSADDTEKAKLEKLEKILYGVKEEGSTPAQEATLPTIDEVLAALS